MDSSTMQTLQEPILVLPWACLEVDTNHLKSPQVTISAGERVAYCSTTIPGGAFGFYHDFVVTDNYYVMVQNPVRMDVTKLVTEYVTAKCGIAQCLKVRSPQPS
jgi:carotenoid cleavage dioxygenase-like enzyme